MAEKNEQKNAGEASVQPQKASVGRVVRYVLDKENHRAAIVAKVSDAKRQIVNLLVVKGEAGELVGQSNVIAGNGAIFPTALVGGVEYDEAGRPGTWHWPTRG